MIKFMEVGYAETMLPSFHFQDDFFTVFNFHFYSMWLVVPYSFLTSDMLFPIYINIFKIDKGRVTLSIYSPVLTFKLYV